MPLRLWSALSRDLSVCSFNSHCVTSVLQSVHYVVFILQRISSRDVYFLTLLKQFSLSVRAHVLNCDTLKC